MLELPEAFSLLYYALTRLKFIVNYFGKKVDLPKWLILDSHKQTLLIDLGKAPKVQGVRVKAAQIDPKNDKFVFKGGFSDKWDVHFFNG